MIDGNEVNESSTGPIPFLGYEDNSKVFDGASSAEYVDHDDEQKIVDNIENNENDNDNVPELEVQIWDHEHGDPQNVTHEEEEEEMVEEIEEEEEMEENDDVEFCWKDVSQASLVIKDTKYAVNTEHCLVLVNESFDELEAALVELCRLEELDQGATLSAENQSQIQSFLDYFTNFGRFCKHEEKDWFQDIVICSDVIAKLLLTAKTVDTLKIALRMTYICARVTEAYDILMQHDVIHVIINQLNVNISDPQISLYSMLAIGNITFQLETFEIAISTILPTILKVIELHMDQAEALEPSLWALANVYFVDTLECTTHVAKLLSEAISRHSDNISLVCEGFHCAYNIACKKSHHKLLLSTDIVSVLASCFENFRSERFVFLALEVLALLMDNLDEAVAQVAQHVHKIANVTKPGYIEGYDFSLDSSHTPKKEEFQRNLTLVIRAMIRTNRLQPVPNLAHAFYLRQPVTPVRPMSLFGMCARTIANNEQVKTTVNERAMTLDASNAIGSCVDTCHLCENKFDSRHGSVIVFDEKIDDENVSQLASYYWTCGHNCELKLKKQLKQEVFMEDIC